MNILTKAMWFCLSVRPAMGHKPDFPPKTRLHFYRFDFFIFGSVVLSHIENLWETICADMFIVWQAPKHGDLNSIDSGHGDLSCFSRSCIWGRFRGPNLTKFDTCIQF